MLKYFFVVLVVLSVGGTAVATAGELPLKAVHDQETDYRDNWRVPSEHAKVVLALGFNTKIHPNATDVMNKISDYAKKWVVPALKVQLQVIHSATTKDVINSMRDPNTIGIIIGTHSYAADTGSVAMMADHQPLPFIFSAATPALRFAAIFNCYGKGTASQNQAEYDLKRLPGKQTFYYSTSDFLSVQKRILFVGMPSLQARIDMMVKTWKGNDPMGLQAGVAPSKPVGEVTIQASDIAKRMEPRYVTYNERIIGTLGTDENDSNYGLEKKTFTFPIPAWADDPRSKPMVTAEPADMSRYLMGDSYLVHSVGVKLNSGETHEKVFAPEAARIGNVKEVYTGKDLPEPEAPEVLRKGPDYTPTSSWELPPEYRWDWESRGHSGDQRFLWRHIREKMLKDYSKKVYEYSWSLAYTNRDPAAWPKNQVRFLSVDFNR